MNREDTIKLAREAGLFVHKEVQPEIERFATLIAAAERKAMMQLFTDPENQPTQHGTVTVEYMQREIAAEREACARVAERSESAYHCAAAIRARGETTSRSEKK